METPQLNPLTEEELIYFSSLTEEQCEDYRQQKYENYTYLKFVESEINSGKISAVGREMEQTELKVIYWYAPCPQDACQALKIMRGEPCDTCMV